MTWSLQMMLCILWYLNPHSHKGSDQVKRHISKTLSYFNPHSHEGSYQELWRITHVLSDFNPHSHLQQFPNHLGISIHIPTKGVTVYNSNSRRYNRKFQSTLPRREWLPCHDNIKIISIISIHTPTKGVTVTNLQTKTTDLISIHTPTKGVTLFRKGKV